METANCPLNNNNRPSASNSAMLLNNQQAQVNKKDKKSMRNHGSRKPPPTLDTFWSLALEEVMQIQQVDARNQVLPLARIKKIMKLDENAKMIAAEAPLLFAKACEYFIQELTMRAWIHTEENRRRTLQRSDIAQAIANYDQFDFLIDIVPREEIKPTLTTSHKRENNQSHAPTTSAETVVVNANKLPQEVYANVTPPSQQPVPTLASQQQQGVQPVQLIQQTAIGANGQPIQYLIALSGQQIPQQTPTQQLIFATGPNGQITAIPANTSQQNAVIQQPQQLQPQVSQIQLLQTGTSQQPK